MAINVTTQYNLEKKHKETISAVMHEELNKTQGAADFGVKRQDLDRILVNVVRRMVSRDKEFSKAFDKALKNY